MNEAIKLARRAAQLEEAPVGCVIVRENKIVGRGFNLRETGKNALNHAELIAIRDACKTLGGWRLCGCDLYVTLEPCPMCAGAMINARIENVYFGAFDPKAGACGSVVNLFDLPFNHKPRVTGGVSEPECAGLLSDFFANLRKGRNL
jgi:tRNA(adenine34) deaminase